MPLTAPWCIGTGVVAAWFGHFAPRTIAASGGVAHMSSAFRVHLLCACSTTLVCVWNHLYTPSEGAQLAMVHKWLGRLAMITSLVGTTLGYVAAWTDVAVPRATAIGLSVVGVLQYWHTVKGYKAIKQAQASVGDERKRLIEIHRASMTNLYYGCCLGPAWFRLPGWLGLIKMGSAPLWAQAAGMLPPFIIMPMALRTSRDKTFF